jgi:hypothetical protein
MHLDTKSSEALVDWRKVHALGLPSGSIRALLAVLIFATVWCLLLMKPTQEIPDYLSDLLFIIMGHYFAARHRAAADAELGPPPLFLPRGSVRLFLLAGSVVVATLLYQRGQLTALDRNPGAVTLLLVGGFLLGVAMSAASAWWRDRGHRTPRFAEDLRAIVSLGAAGFLVFLVLNRLLLFFPPDRINNPLVQWVQLGRFGPEHVLAAVVGFYFGSRS